MYIYIYLYKSYLYKSWSPRTHTHIHTHTYTPTHTHTMCHRKDAQEWQGCEEPWCPNAESASTNSQGSYAAAPTSCARAAAASHHRLQDFFPIFCSEKAISRMTCSSIKSTSPAWFRFSLWFLESSFWIPFSSIKSSSPARFYSFFGFWQGDIFSAERHHRIFFFGVDPCSDGVRNDVVADNSAMRVCGVCVWACYPNVALKVVWQMIALCVCAVCVCGCGLCPFCCMFSRHSLFIHVCVTYINMYVYMHVW